MKIVEDCEQSLGRFRINASRWFVQNEERRIVGQCPGNRGTLLLAPGQRGWEPVGFRFQANHLEQSCRTLAALVPVGRGVERHGQNEIVLGGNCRQQLEELENDPERARAPSRAPIFVERADILAVDQDFAARRIVEAGDEVQQSRLATAGLADDSDILAPIDGQVGRLECLDICRP